MSHAYREDLSWIHDLGFGDLARNAGYKVLGIDLSPAMIEMARRRVPEGRLRCESLLTAELPPCIAVAAVGECFNYRLDESNSREQLRALFRRIHAALLPGGILLFDAAGPGRVPGDELLEDLTAAGFATEVLGAYGRHALPAGLNGFLARPRAQQ